MPQKPVILQLLVIVYSGKCCYLNATPHWPDVFVKIGPKDQPVSLGVVWSEDDDGEDADHDRREGQGNDDAVDDVRRPGTDETTKLFLL